MTYQEANAKLTGRNRDRRKLANNTYLERRGEEIAIRLHATDIMTFRQDGSTVLNSGGWKTVTTKSRMNEYLAYNYYIQQERGQWYIVQRGVYSNKLAVYADGMVIHANGSMEGAETVEEAKAALKLRKQVSKYADGYVKALRAGKVPAPGSGDCWGCLMTTTDKKRSPMGGRDHILSHMEEKYYVPSLIKRAFDEFGASIAMKDALARIWQDGNDIEAKKWGDFVFEQMRTMIRRFCLRELGQAA